MKARKWTALCAILLFVLLGTTSVFGDASPRPTPNALEAQPKFVPATAQATASATATYSKDYVAYLEADLAREREKIARLEGELQAARCAGKFDKCKELTCKIEECCKNVASKLDDLQKAIDALSKKVDDVPDQTVQKLQAWFELHRPKPGYNNLDRVRDWLTFVGVVRLNLIDYDRGGGNEKDHGGGHCDGGDEHGHRER